MVKSYKLTAEKLQELEDELVYLKTVREKEVAEQIKEARSFGDLSENAEYDEAKNEQGKLYSRIVEIENVIQNAVIIENDVATDQVDTGLSVTVTNTATKAKSTYKIVGSKEANPVNGCISEESPFGIALLGKRVGEKATVEAPVGIIEFEICEITK